MSGTIRVLFVDDDGTARRTHAGALARRDGIDVVTAHSAAAGLDALSESDVDCVVSDLEMPGSDGIEFLEAVRDARPEVPFVLFSSHRSAETVSRALEAGVSDYVLKQSCTESCDLLVNRIETLVGYYRTRERLG